jgi:HSP20 family molecular chaperone IbpA
MSKEKSKKTQIWVNGCMQCDCGCSDEEDGVDMTFELPGVKKEDIKLNIMKTGMKLTADRNDIEYVSSYDFECEADLEKVKAKYDNGLLTVHIPESCPDPFKDSKSVKID